MREGSGGLTKRRRQEFVKAAKTFFLCPVIIIDTDKRWHMIPVGKCRSNLTS